MPKRNNLFVLTSKRDTPDPYQYLTATLAQIDANLTTDVGSKVIVSDGKYDGPRLPGWEVSEYLGKAEGTKGNRDAWFYLIEIAAGYGSDALCLEDDLEICPGGINRMVDFKVPGDVSGIRFFTPKVTSISQANGLHRLPPNVSLKNGALFLQAVKFSHTALIELDLFRQHNPNYNNTPESADQTVGNACEQLTLRIAAHKPDLVQHVGHVSKATPKLQKLAWWRQSQSYQVELDIDALDASLYQ